MEYDKIKLLLARYYEGTTTFEEERLLHYFFLYGDVPAGMQVDKKLFLSLQNEKEITGND